MKLALPAFWVSLLAADYIIYLDLISVLLICIELERESDTSGSPHAEVEGLIKEAAQYALSGDGDERLKKKP